MIYLDQTETKIAQVCAICSNCYVYSSRQFFVNENVVASNLLVFRCN